MWRDIRLLQLAHRHRAAWLLVQLGNRLAELMMGGLDMSKAWLEIQVEQHNVALVRPPSHQHQYLHLEMRCMKCSGCRGGYATFS
jgi:hypothetical protein